MEENAEEIIQEAVEVAGLNADLDQGIEAELQNLDQLLNNNNMNNSNMRHVVQLQQQQGDGDPGPSGDSVLIIERDEHNTIHEFAHTIREAASLFSTYNKTLRLIELSASEDFAYWDKLSDCVSEIATCPRVTEKIRTMSRHSDYFSSISNWTWTRCSTWAR